MPYSLGKLIKCSWIFEIVGSMKISLSVCMLPLHFGRILVIFDESGNTPDSKERFISK